MIEKQGDKMEDEFDWSKLSDKERAWALLLLLFATSDNDMIEKMKKEGEEDEQKRTGKI